MTKRWIVCVALIVLAGCSGGSSASNEITTGSIFKVNAQGAGTLCAGTADGDRQLTTAALDHEGDPSAYQRAAMRILTDTGGTIFNMGEHVKVVKIDFPDEVQMLVTYGESEGKRCWLESDMLQKIVDPL